jgi:hypothetical protein
VGSIVGFLTNGEKMKSKQVKWTSLVGVFALVGMSLLSACGDDSASPLAPQVSEKESSSSKIKSSSSVKRTSVESMFELGACKNSNIGERIFVSEEVDYYTCSYIDGKYTWASEKKAKSSSSVKSSSSSAKLSSSSVKSSSSTKAYTNVSDVWTGKMTKPSTEFIDGKSFMLIYTAEELAYFADQVTNKGEERLNAKLMQHIRLNPDNMVDEKGNLILPQSSLNEWTPIGGGTDKIMYKGTFDGNGYIVSGIYVNKPAYERAGFIGTLGGTNSSDSAHVLFLGIRNSYIVGGEQVGGIAGRMNRSEIQQVFNRRSYVKGSKYVGGIVGYKNYGWLYYAYNSGMVVSSDNRASGIAGYNDNSSTSIQASYNIGFLIAPNKGTTAGISTSANSSKNCFYIDQSDREIVANGASEKTELFMISDEFVSTLNGLSFENIWTSDDDGINDGYPVFKWEKPIIR